MRRITFSILLLISTQAFGMLRLLPRVTRFAPQALRSKFRSNVRPFPQRPLEAFALLTRRCASKSAPTNVAPQKKCSNLKLASIFFAGGVAGGVGGGALGFNVGMENGLDAGLLAAQLGIYPR